MGNPLFNAMYGDRNAQTHAETHQNSLQGALSQLMENPSQMIRQAGYSVPDSILGDPRATVMHLIQSGQVKAPMMQRIQPMLNMLMGRK